MLRASIGSDIVSFEANEELVSFAEDLNASQMLYHKM